MSYWRIAVTLAVLTAVAGVIGCPQTGKVSYCEHEDLNHYDKDGELDPCHCDDDAGTVGARSPGYCQAFLAGKDAGDASTEDP